MKLEQQVVSLELAKKMKELEFLQESLFYWNYDGLPEGSAFNYSISNDYLENGYNLSSFPAYTVAELGEMLPINYLSRLNEFGDWMCYGKKSFCGYAKTEADARAKMLIYLAENNLINPKDTTL